ncbi:hypothetical protein P4O66_009813, partial [Electrophorus voltai]
KRKAFLLLLIFYRLPCAPSAKQSSYSTAGRQGQTETATITVASNHRDEEQGLRSEVYEGRFCRDNESARGILINGPGVASLRNAHKYLSPQLDKRAGLSQRAERTRRRLPRRRGRAELME